MADVDRMTVEARVLTMPAASVDCSFHHPEGISHRDGISWLDAPRPRRFHRCRVQTEGVIGGLLGDLVQRCACGAVRLNNGGWFERNSRKS